MKIQSFITVGQTTGRNSKEHMSSKRREIELLLIIMFSRGTIFGYSSRDDVLIRNHGGGSKLAPSIIGRKCMSILRKLNKL